MVAVAAKKLKNGRAAKSADALRDSVNKKPKAAAKSPEILAAETASGVPWGERTELAKNCGKLVNAIFRFTKKHDIPPSLKRRLINCANDLWDVEWEEDGKSGALERAFGDTAECARQAGTRGENEPL